MKKIDRWIVFMIVIALCGFLSGTSAYAAPKLKSFGTVNFAYGGSEESVSIQKGADKLHLSLVNGDGSGSNKASSAQIKVNGVVLFGPSDFNQNVEGVNKIIVDVSDRTEVTLEAEVMGSKNSKMSVTVFGEYSETVLVTWYLDTDGNDIGGEFMTQAPEGVEPDPYPPYKWVTVTGDFDDWPM
ncbi:MAG: hypothetical protein JSV00_10285 [bacterium]|nr:MAG: hypothetical protein JSV00_10285 [bacterium]